MLDANLETHESWCTLPACYQPALLVPSLPYCGSLHPPRPASALSPNKMARGKVCDGGTRGLPFLSWTKSCPAHILSLACHCAGFSRAARCWAAVRVTQWPADLREKTDVPINFCQNVITSGLENHMGVGRTGTDVWLSNMQSSFCRSLNNQEVKTMAAESVPHPFILVPSCPFSLGPFGSLSYSALHWWRSEQEEYMLHKSIILSAFS